MLGLGGRDRLAVEITTDRGSEPYSAGDAIRASVLLRAQQEVRIKTASVALVGKEEYQVRQDADEDTMAYRWRTDESEVEVTSFLEGIRLEAGSSHRHEYVVETPPGAAPSGQGAILKVTWAIQVLVQMGLFARVEQHAPVLVGTTPPDHERESTRLDNYSSDPDAADLELLPRSNEAWLGGAVEGTVRVRLKQDFEVREVRLELRREEEVPADKGQEAVDAVATTTVASGLSLGPGQEHFLPFRVAVPASAAVTMQTAHGTIRWKLRGTLDRPRRPDTFVEKEIFVYHRPRAGRP